jgi:hypothetical protein
MIARRRLALRHWAAVGGLFLLGVLLYLTLIGSDRAL